MFQHPSSGGLPLRNRKDFARMLRQNGLQHSHSEILNGACNDLLVPRTSSSRWHRHYHNMTTSSLADRFQDLLSPSLSGSASYGSLHDRRSGTSHDTYFSKHNKHKGSFKKAASSLYVAIQRLRYFCGFAEHSFAQETRSIELWASPEVVDMLWKMKMEWNGVPVANFERIHDPSHDDRQLYYRKPAMEVLRAWNELHSAGPVPYEVLEITDSSLTEVEVKTALRKLDVIFQGIEELIQAVRTDRTKMRGLSGQLEDATFALDDIAVIWKPEGQRQNAQRMDENRWYE